MCEMPGLPVLFISILKLVAGIVRCFKSDRPAGTFEATKDPGYFIFSDK